MNAQNQLAQCAAPLNEIPAEMDSLQSSIHCLGEKLSRLGARIDPILRDSPMCAGDRSPGPPLASKLAMELRSIIQTVHAMSDMVEGITDRVAL